MIKIAICDDSKSDTDALQKCIIEYMNRNKVLFKISSYISGESLLQATEQFNIVFLDIEMKGLNGIQTGKSIRSKTRNVKIIYITNFSKYWIDAINNIHAFAYLGKPIKELELFSQMDEIMYNLHEEKLENETISFDVFTMVNKYKIDTEYKEFDVEEIVYFEYVDRKIMLKTEKKVYFFTSQMYEVAEKMKKYKFAKCHRCLLVNLKYVKNIKGYSLFLKTGEELTISQKKSAEFREKVNRFIQNSI